MVETTTINEDAGKRCHHCGKDIHRHTTTWFIAQHGDYCSRACGEAGASELEAMIRQLEKHWEGEGANCE